MSSSLRPVSAAPGAGNDDDLWFVQVGVHGRDGQEMRFAIDTRNVVEVSELGKVEPLPPGSEPFVGVCDLRGLPVPLLDLRLCLVGLTECRDEVRPTRVVVLNEGTRRIGVLVARTFQNRSHSPSDLLPTPVALARVHGGAISHLLRTGQGYVYVLEVTHLMNAGTPA